MNPAEHHIAFGHSDSLDDKQERLRLSRERDRDRCAAETDEQRENGCSGSDSETGLGALLYPA